MVGTLKLSGHTFALIQTKDGLVHRVTEGNYLGQAEGKITEIAPSKIVLVEIVPDGLGGYMERPAALAPQPMTRRPGSPQFHEATD